MRWFLDTHLHLYPGQETGLALEFLCRHAAAADPSARVGAILLDRADTRAYDRLSEGSDTPGQRADARCVALAGGAALEFRLRDGRSGVLFPGAQIATRERLEVLALCTRARVPDGLPLDETLARVQAAGGLPALPWALGKWTGRRGAQVARHAREASPGALLFGDSALRPRGWPEPAPLRLARTRGLPMIAGSDVLPWGGEETRAGQYATLLAAGPAEAGDADGMRRALATSAGMTTVGARLGIWAVWRRWRRLMFSRSPAAFPGRPPAGGVPTASHT